MQQGSSHRCDLSYLTMAVLRVTIKCRNHGEMYVKKHQENLCFVPFYSAGFEEKNCLEPWNTWL